MGSGSDVQLLLVLSKPTPSIHPTPLLNYYWSGTLGPEITMLNVLPGVRL